jgi:hypothetical protein
MTSVSGRYVITYNGKVYNFRSLMSDLKNADTSFVVIPIPKQFWQASSSGAWNRH